MNIIIHNSNNLLISPLHLIEVHPNYIASSKEFIIVKGNSNLGDILVAEFVIY